MQTSKVNASPCRILLAFDRKGRWKGGRPAIVVGGPWGETQRANVNVFFDGLNDRGMLAEVRGRPDGNTFGSVLVFDDHATAERELEGTTEDVFAVWPPPKLASMPGPSAAISPLPCLDTSMMGKHCRDKQLGGEGVITGVAMFQGTEQPNYRITPTVSSTGIRSADYWALAEHVEILGKRVG